jgi:DNA-binding MarR family transcriptional regulator
MTDVDRRPGVASFAGRGAVVGTAEEPPLLYAVKQVELAIRAHMDALLKPTGITALQYTALTVLRHRDGLSSAELARNSFVTAQTMGEMVSALEARGLVARRADPDHKRRMLTSLTAAGLDLLTRCDAEVGELEATMVAELNWRQRQALRTYLESCRTALAETALR